MTSLIFTPNYLIPDSDYLFSRFFEVCLDVKLSKEEEEHDSVSRDVVRELPGEVAVVVQEQLEAVDHDSHELDHLQSGHVLLPPDVLLVLRT